MKKNNVLFYLSFVRVFDEDNRLRYIPVTLEDLKDPWEDDDILVLFNTSEEESDKILTLLGEYVEVK